MDMKQIGMLLLLVAFVFSLSPGFSQNSNAIVRFGDLHGEVNVRPDSEDDDAYIFAELKTPLKHDDRIKTLPKSGAILSFSDMTTFVMKEDTVIVLDIANERESKIGLVAGNVWVNLKKMVADGSMEVEMAQAVAGIKGTNITCSSDPQTQEDRVAVMRGRANVRVKESGEEFVVEEGEEIVIKKDAKPEKLEIDIQTEQGKWDEDLSRIGESIDVNDLPEIFRNINESSAAEFGKLNGTFQNLMVQEKVELADAVSLRTSAERFVGVIMENLLVLNNSKRRIDAATTVEGLSNEQRAQLNSLIREMAASIAAQTNFQAEAARMMRYQFRTSAIDEDIQSTLEMIRTELAGISNDLEKTTDSDQPTDEIDALKAEIAQVTGAIETIRAGISNSSGQSQDWFLESVEELNSCSASLEAISLQAANLNTANEQSQGLSAIGARIDELSQRVSGILSQHPGSMEAQSLSKLVNGLLAQYQVRVKTSNDSLSQAQSILKSVADQQTAIASLLKLLVVVEVDASTIAEMQQYEFDISEAIASLELAVRDYPESSASIHTALTRSTVEEQEARLKASVEIMRNFTIAKRTYDKAQRKYDSTMRSTAGSSFRTGEQEEMESLWLNISDRFQQLGVVAEELQQHIQELEDDLNHMLNR